MKLNWGTGITITIIVFTLVSLAFVYFALNQDVNLVRDDYYEAEVNFNNQMETVKRTKPLSDEVKIKTTTDYIEIKFPEKFAYNEVKGKINLYRPSDRNKDLELEIKLDTSETQFIKTNNLISGMWKLNIDWSVDSLKYFTNKSVMVP